MTYRRTAGVPLRPTPRGKLVRAVLRYVEAALDDGQTGIYSMMIDRIEKPLLESALSHCRGNKVRMAAALGINRNTIRMKMKRHGLT